MNDSTLPQLKTDRLRIKLLEPAHEPLMTHFRIDNKKHLTKWEPTRTPEFYTDAFWYMQLKIAIREFRNRTNLRLVILNEMESRVIGVCNYTNIVRGTFQSCHLGYALDKEYEGQGLMFEALQISNNYVFEKFSLHRIMANYMPLNKRSGDLLSRLGFTIEGEARSFLKIHGRWEDHILTSLVNPSELS